MWRPERLSYGPSRQQFVELLGQGDRDDRVAVLLHGGYWKALYNRRLEHAVGRDLAGRGWMVFNVEYRRIGNGGGWTETFDDVRAAFALVPERPAVIGHSAGGHLALWAAAEGLASRVVAQAPVTDLRTIGRPEAARLLGGRPDEVPDRYAAASPAARAPLGVPTLLLHGTADHDVPQSQATSYAAVAGPECTFEWVEGEDHMAHVDPRSRSWERAVEWLER